MLRTELWGLRRVVITAALALVASQPACVVGPPPLPAEMPPQPGADPQAVADAPQQGGDPAPGQDANVEDFYEPLAAYGSWVDTSEYGRVWQPSDDVAGDGFTPYASDGSWATNDDGDWVFESRYDSEWGWAAYHYGRWAEHPDYGWVWVPGTVWAPSWVEWRYGGGYVGWVPMGPPGVVFVESRWFFVEEQYFGSPAIYSYRLPPDRVRIAYVAAQPIVEVRGRAGWRVGPPVARVRAHTTVRVARTAYARPPARGYVRATARAAAQSAAARPRPAAKPRVRNNPRPAHHDAPPARHDTPRPAHDTPKPIHHDKPTIQRDAPRPKAAPPPKPKPAAPSKRGGGKRR